MARLIFDHNRGWRRLCALSVAAMLWSGSVLAASGKSAADYFVKSLPGAPDGPLLKMHAGHIEVSPESHGNLFFWHFQNRHISDKQRTVIWLNGGPGCSSLDGALMEVGPYRVGPGGKLSYNNGSWDEFANLMFVDQPVGTGFSYVDTNAYIHDLDTMADNFVTFLESFMDIFPDYAHDDLYFAGESFAGQFIPYITKAILQRNKANPAKAWNLAGLLIGNGWIAPTEQYDSYLKFAIQAGLLESGGSKAEAVNEQVKRCTADLEAGGAHHVHTPECENILQKILEQLLDESAPADQQCVNIYDVRLRDSYSSCGMNWPPDLVDITPYARQPDVRAALNIDPQNQVAWTECSGSVGSAFTVRTSPPAIDLLPDILAEVPVVLFSGDQDLICNHIGTEALIHNMDWSGGRGFELPGAPGTWAPRQDWSFEGEPAGFYQAARNLTYVLFYNASHMVPFDYPRRSRDMLDRFMGVDISSIGGQPGESRIDGEAALTTSVGDAAAADAKGRVKQAAVNAYYKSGEVVLVLLLLGLAAWGFWFWRGRRRRAGYLGLGRGDDGSDGGDAGTLFRNMTHAVLQSPAAGHGVFRDRATSRDLEAADFDENELADLTTPRSHRGGGGYDDDDDDDDGDDDGAARPLQNGDAKH